MVSVKNAKRIEKVRIFITTHRHFIVHLMYYVLKNVHFLGNIFFEL